MRKSRHSKSSSGQVHITSLLRCIYYHRNIIININMLIMMFCLLAFPFVVLLETDAFVITTTPERSSFKTSIAGRILLSKTDSKRRYRRKIILPPISLRSKMADNNNNDEEQNTIQVVEEAMKEYNSLLERNGSFDLTTALFCGGLAFDAYSDPPTNSSRWERGSSGCNVAFQSQAFTRSIYKAILQIKPIKCTDLPDEDDNVEGIMTGGGADAYLMVAVAEGKWKEDIAVIEKSKLNDGVLSLQGCAHVGRSSTAWSNVNESKAKQNLKRGESGAYHIKSSWGKGGQAIWESDDPFYLYVQDPKDARVVFTVMDDDVIGGGSPIGSTSRKLIDILPNAAKADDPVSSVKDEIMKRIKKGENVNINDWTEVTKYLSQEWNGDVKLTSKPKKKDKNGQIAAAAAAGAMVAGPAGAAVGGLMASFYEGEVRGRVFVDIKLMPIPNVPPNRQKYKVKGGLPGVDWGELYERHIQKLQKSHQNLSEDDLNIGGNDLEFCCFVNHKDTGCSCAIYRSLEKKLIALSFRGTCQPVDLATDANIIQETWVEGEDIEADDAIKVHIGFRKSLNSISRKLKELLLATVAPGDNISDYDMIVTGHSLGGALATLFTADIGEYGIDAGRGLPQVEESEPWWNSLASTFFNNKDNTNNKPKDTKPPRPKSLKMYNFGSPRVGNKEFTQKFDSLVGRGNGIDEAYRIVNGQDVVARLPRTVNALNIVKIGYEHCGPTVLISIPNQIDKGLENNNDVDDVKVIDSNSLLWIEGESEGECPVRDGTALRSPLAQGSFLGDILSAVQVDEVINDITTTSTTTQDQQKSTSYLEKGDVFSKLTSAVKDRMETFTASDAASIVGIDQKFIERESKIIQSVLSGQALSHHMEDQYYSAMGRACGFVALVGDQIRSLDENEIVMDVVTSITSNDDDDDDRSQ